MSQAEGKGNSHKFTDSSVSELISCEVYDINLHSENRIPWKQAVHGLWCSAAIWGENCPPLG